MVINLKVAIQKMKKTTLRREFVSQYTSSVSDLFLYKFI